MKYVFMICAILVLVVSVFMMSIALEHNPIGEFREYSDLHGEQIGQIQWLHLFELGFLWFIAVFLFFFCAAFIGKFVVARFFQ